MTKTYKLDHIDNNLEEYWALAKDGTWSGWRIPLEFGAGAFTVVVNGEVARGGYILSTAKCALFLPKRLAPADANVELVCEA